MEREKEGEREWEKDKDCARSRPPHGCCPVSNCISCFISLSRGNRHCLSLYGRAKRRARQREEREEARRRGNCAGNAMLESVLTRRSLRHFIKSGHGAVQFSTHFLCTASRATSFSSPLFLAILCVISVLPHFVRCPSQLSCSCRNAIHSWPKSFHLALTTFGILELTSRAVVE